MINNPLVSVTIPTYNSGKTLEKCLVSIMNQNYQNIEVIVVDSQSVDRTIEIAEKYGAEIVQIEGKLLEARYMGLELSRGDFLLFMDSDQILKNNHVLSDGVKLTQDSELDMLILEEFSYEPNNWLEKLFESDRKFLHENASIHLDPVRGVMLPRFFRREILEKAFSAIPKEIMPVVVCHDHAIIYFEAYKVSQKVRVLPDSIYHIEPSSVIEMIKKNYRYGKTIKDMLRENSYYNGLIKNKESFRKGLLKSRNRGIIAKSIVLTLLRGIPYKIGYWTG